MLLSSLRKFGARLTGRADAAKRNPAKHRAPRRQSLALEALEERCVPAHLQWTGFSGVDKNFATKQNWLDVATSTAPTSAPGPGDTVEFANWSLNDDVKITTTSVACARIISHSSWTGKITIDDGQLTIWGKNSASASSFEGGEIRAAGTHTAAVNLLGGTLDYKARNLNINGLGGVQKPLELRVGGGGVVNFTTDTAQQGATLFVGNNARTPLA
jgi:hypothetical protein